MSSWIQHLQKTYLGNRLCLTTAQSAPRYLPAHLYTCQTGSECLWCSAHLYLQVLRWHSQEPFLDLREDDLLQGCPPHSGLQRPSWVVLLSPEHPADDLLVFPVAPLEPLGRKHLAQKSLTRKYPGGIKHGLSPPPRLPLPTTERRKCLGNIY